jgi:hypothetical protein
LANVVSFYNVPASCRVSPSVPFRSTHFRDEETN